MAEASCGFSSSAGVDGSKLLEMLGPILLVSIGFDPGFRPSAFPPPATWLVEALVDTGAQESCIDSLLASELNLPIIDKRPVAGIGGMQPANIHIAQIHVPALSSTIYGAFASVHLAATGQRHRALIGRTFLRNFTMTYQGRTGAVTISS
jgi:predicted aspartyl protease